MLINLPEKVLIEKRILNINEFLKDLDIGKKIAFFCGHEMMYIIGKPILDSIKDFDISIVEPKSTDFNYLKKLSLSIAKNDFSIGIGGGRTIDIAKYSSFLAGKPWIAFPTILSHDGIVSSRASIEHNNSKISLDANEPVAIIADLDTIKSAPYRWIAAGCGDLLANISAVNDWKIADKAGVEKYNALIGELSLLSAKAVIAHIDEIRNKTYHGLEILLWALICSGFSMNIYGSSRPASGSEHNFSHVLDKLGGNKLHGEQCGLGTIVSLYLQEPHRRTECVSGFDWMRIKNVMRQLGLPTNTREIGISKDVLIRALVDAKNVRERYTIFNEKEITEKDAEKILREVGII